MMPPILYTDEVLLYGIARYFGLRKGKKRSSAAMAVAGLLLALYRVKGPVRRDPLMEAAGLGHNGATTFRTYIHFLRSALGDPNAIYITGYEWQLSFEARAEMDKAFAFIQNELEEAIRPTRTGMVVAMVRATA